MSKQDASNSFRIIDQVINDIDKWLVDKDCDWDELENELDNLCGKLDEENKNNIVILLNSFSLKMNKLLKILATKKNNH